MLCLDSTIAKDHFAGEAMQGSQKRQTHYPCRMQLGDGWLQNLHFSSKSPQAMENEILHCALLLISMSITALRLREKHVRGFKGTAKYCNRRNKLGHSEVAYPMT